MLAKALAAAKINLFLHVGGLDADGFHPLSSLMVFADIGDEISVHDSDAPAFEVTGPFAAGVPTDERNLVVRAARALAAKAGRPLKPVRVVLDKQLPVASGLGGGSSDAGTALRLLREVLNIDIDDARLEAVAASLGSDGAACLWGRTVIGEGRGERLSPPPGLPPLDAVLVNPGVPTPTGAVYAAYDAAGAPGGADRPALPAVMPTVQEAAALLSLTRNDLEGPAVSLVPGVGEALALMRSQGEALLTRMSGSGATCFSLCPGPVEAAALAERLATLRPGWWVRACRLNGEAGQSL